MASDEKPVTSNTGSGSSQHCSSRPSTPSSASSRDGAMSTPATSRSSSPSVAKYRDHSSSTKYVDVKKLSHPRGKPDVVVIQHHRQGAPDKAEPRTADYYNRNT
ncbi:hypothetical protein VTJ83DRAFT_3026 [Remersonia thermophila]|uniref:Uncharacterized protein n=1 Tax=Remersonia thermophila TaxID=72144 RepID=A0ABR4DCY6_9PEZI